MKFVFSHVLYIALVVFFDLQLNVSARITRKSRKSLKVCGRDMDRAMNFFCPEANFTLPYQLRYTGGKFLKGFESICVNRVEYEFNASNDKLFMLIIVRFLVQQ